MCAYLIANQEVTSTELRNYLRNKLPEYMIPSHFVQLESMPLTNNDKVDVRALQERDDENYISLGTTYMAPGTNLEK